MKITFAVTIGIEAASPRAAYNHLATILSHPAVAGWATEAHVRTLEERVQALGRSLAALEDAMGILTELRFAVKAVRDMFPDLCAPSEEPGKPPAPAGQPD